MAPACPSGHLEAPGGWGSSGRKRSGGSGGARGAERAWREVGGNDLVTWVPSRESRGGHLSFYLNTLAFSHYVTFQTELHFLGSPAVTLSHSLHY